MELNLNYLSASLGILKKREFLTTRKGMNRRPRPSRFRQLFSRTGSFSYFIEHKHHGSPNEFPRTLCFRQISANIFETYPNFENTSKSVLVFFCLKNRSGVNIFCTMELALAPHSITSREQKDVMFSHNSNLFSSFL